MPEGGDRDWRRRRRDGLIAGALLFQTESSRERAQWAASARRELTFGEVDAHPRGTGQARRRRLAASLCPRGLGRDLLPCVLPAMPYMGSTKG